MISISLCMIVKNEEESLPRILELMCGVVDEIIIVDTGSTDSTKDIARKYTPLVFDFSWNQDFSAARNYACSKATMDYWMWMDADDMITPANRKTFMELKSTLNPDVDMVFMKYITGFDINGRPAFSYYRERLIKNGCGYLWHGRVHEAVIPSGNLLYSQIEIEHRKIGPGDPDRNLKIYESMLENGEILEPRHQFYYGRELFYHARYEDAAATFCDFLNSPDGWVENKIDACLQLSHCYQLLGREKEALSVLFQSFSYDVPRAEICCEIGRLLLNAHAYKQAAYWYEQALASTTDESTGAFIQKDYHNYIPLVQLCVCYDQLGEHKKAFAFHKRAMALKPETQEVQLNQVYFEKLFALPSVSG